MLLGVQEIERANTGVDRLRKYKQISANMADITERLLDIVGQ